MKHEPFDPVLYHSKRSNRCAPDRSHRGGWIAISMEGPTE
jgi:hypothetical protein